MIVLYLLLFQVKLVFGYPQLSYAGTNAAAFSKFCSAKPSLSSVHHILIKQRAKLTIARRNRDGFPYPCSKSSNPTYRNLMERMNKPRILPRELLESGT